MDAVVAALLVATIGFAVRLNNRLLVLRADQDRLQELIAGLQRATRQAEDAVRGLKLSAAESGQALHDATERAGTLRDDLAFLVERGGTLADRLEAATRPRADPAAIAREPAPVFRPEAPVEPPPSPAAPPRPRLADGPEPGGRREPTIDTPRPVEPPATSERAAPSRSERELQRLLDGKR
jgi:hypothetical protein